MIEGSIVGFVVKQVSSWNVNALFYQGTDTTTKAIDQALGHVKVAGEALTSQGLPHW